MCTDKQKPFPSTHRLLPFNPHTPPPNTVTSKLTTPGVNPVIAYLWILRVLGLVIEMKNVRLCTSPRMQITHSHQGGYRVSVTQRLHCRVSANTDTNTKLGNVRVDTGQYGYRILIGCWMGFSQSVYSFRMAEKISLR